MRIALVNPPFANVRRPSLGLTQLRTALKERLPGITVDIHNLNLDVLWSVGFHWYTEISDGLQSWTGLGDWLFRQLAFPDEPDNVAEYLDWLRESTGISDADEAAILEHRRKVVASYPRLVEARDLASYDVVGVTSMFAQNLAAIATLRLVKTANPEVVTVLGGANCESPMGDAMLERFEEIDVVFSGRSVGSFTRFIEGLAASPGSSVRREVVPPKPAYANEAPVPISIKPTKSQRDSGLNRPFSTPALEFDDFVAEFQASALPQLTDMVLPFETSIGCWWGERLQCTFCGLNSTTMDFRALMPDEAVEHINGLIRRYGDVCKQFEAVDNILSEVYFTDVLPRLEAPPDVSIFYEVKANLTEEKVQAMADARVTRIQPGVEALSTEALRLVKKGTNAFQNVALLRNCRAYGVWPDWNLLIGIPGESDAIYDQYSRELPKLSHLQAPDGAHIIRFDRFSPYFDLSESFGIELRPFAFYSYLYPFEEAWLAQVAYFFADRRWEANTSVLTERLTEIRAIVDYWRDLWTGEPPVLELLPGGGLVDTRPMALEQWTALDPGCVLALDHLRKPRTRDRLADFLEKNGLSRDEIASVERFLDDRQLLFEEGRHVMSIVTGKASVFPRSENLQATTV